jgi:hypothetical protein
MNFLVLFALKLPIFNDAETVPYDLIMLLETNLVSNIRTKPSKKIIIFKAQLALF